MHIEFDLHRDKTNILPLMLIVRCKPSCMHSFSLAIYSQTVLEAITNNHFDKQKSSRLPLKGVLDCQNDDVECKLNILDCQQMLFGNLKCLFWQSGTQFCIKSHIPHCTNTV